ncbi:MAG: alpha/beta hydrolase, partial [Rudaea sp.]
FTPLAAGLWVYQAEFSEDAYVEYSLIRGGAGVPDPLNRRRVPNGLGGRNQFFYMPKATPTPLAQHGRNVRRGTITRHLIHLDQRRGGGCRAVHLYRPPSVERVPLLVVFDGSDYMKYARLAVIVDNLIAESRIRPLAMAFVDNAGPTRMIEYGAGETLPLLLLNELLPLARGELDLLDVEAEPGAFGLLGASMGGLASLYTALRLPHIFGRVLAQSGAFTLFGWDTVVYDLVRDGPVRPLRIWMDCGGLEQLVETNRRMHALLQAKGYDVCYREYSGGHHWTAWRDDVWRGLEALFPPPIPVERPV